MARPHGDVLRRDRDQDRGAMSVSKWEIAGVPSAVVFSAAHSLGLFDRLGVTDAQLPHLMVLAFVAVAVLRGLAERVTHD